MALRGAVCTTCQKSGTVRNAPMIGSSSQQKAAWVSQYDCQDQPWTFFCGT